VDPPIETAARNAAIVFAELGATVRDVDLGDPDSLHPRLKLLVPTNIAARNRKRLKEHPETFGLDVCERMSLGLTTSGVGYADRLRLIEGWQMQARRQFESIDIIVTPTVASPAPLAAASADMIATTAGADASDLHLVLPSASRPLGSLGLHRVESAGRNAVDWAAMVRGKTARGGCRLPGRHRFPPTAAAGLRLAASGAGFIGGHRMPTLSFGGTPIPRSGRRHA
jgi:hypothetical protein